MLLLATLPNPPFCADRCVAMKNLSRAWSEGRSVE